MTYIQQWEQMREKVRNLEQERKTQLILAPNNAYGFKLNINHPLIRPKWDAFKSACGYNAGVQRGGIFFIGALVCQRQIRFWHSCHDHAVILCQVSDHAQRLRRVFRVAVQDVTAAAITEHLLAVRQVI